MSANEIIEQAIDLKPQDRYLVIEQLILSLNEPDKDIENLWIEESDRRLKEYKKGSLKTASFDEVFSKWNLKYLNLPEMKLKMQESIIIYNRIV